MLLGVRKTHPYIHTRTDTHTPTYAHAHTSYRYTHAHTHTHAYTNTQKHIRAHPYKWHAMSLVLVICKFILGQRRVMQERYCWQQRGGLRCKLSFMAVQVYCGCLWLSRCIVAVYGCPGVLCKACPGVLCKAVQVYCVKLSSCPGVFCVKLGRVCCVKLSKSLNTMPLRSLLSVLAAGLATGLSVLMGRVEGDSSSNASTNSPYNKNSISNSSSNSTDPLSGNSGSRDIISESSSGSSSTAPVSGTSVAGSSAARSSELALLAHVLGRAVPPAARHAAQQVRGFAQLIGSLAGSQVNSIEKLKTVYLVTCYTFTVIKSLEQSSGTHRS